MTRRLAFIAAAAATISAVPVALAQEPVAKPDSSGYIAANGVDYWFEIRGKGEPLLLLHGGLFSTELFGPVLTKLAESRRVIGVDLHGHGHTSLGSRSTISLEDLGRDLGVVIQKLGLRQVDAMGYSFGAGAALQLAFQRPELVRRLVVVSAPYAQDGFFAEMLPQQAAVSAAVADQMKETPLRKPYKWSENVKKLTMPVMLVYGDADMIRPEHIVAFYKLLASARRPARSAPNA